MKTIEKLYYTIGEVSDMLSMKPSQLRHWETEIDALKPRKNRHGNRTYTKEDIDNIRLIQHYIEQGYRLDGVNRQLAQQKKPPLETLEIVDRLKRIREFLVTLRSE